MQRRKFLIGAGSLAAGTAAAMGTGAFSSVEADRTVTVNVSDDAYALLALDAKSGNQNSAYADESAEDGAIAIDISDSNDGVSGDGVNPNATTRIFDIFTVMNQGTQPAVVWVPPDSVSGPGNPTSPDSGIYVDPQATDRPNGSFSSEFYDGHVSSNGEVSLTGIYDLAAGSTFEEYILNTDATWADFTLGVGESFDFGLWIESHGDVFTNGTIGMTIKASATAEVGSKPESLGGPSTES